MRAPALMRWIQRDRKSRFFTLRSRYWYCRAFCTRWYATEYTRFARPRKPLANLMTFLCRWFAMPRTTIDAHSIAAGGRGAASRGPSAKGPTAPLPPPNRRIKPPSMTPATICATDDGLNGLRVVGGNLQLDDPGRIFYKRSACGSFGGATSERAPPPPGVCGAAAKREVAITLNLRRGHDEYTL